MIGGLSFFILPFSFFFYYPVSLYQVIAFFFKINPALSHIFHWFSWRVHRGRKEAVLATKVRRHQQRTLWENCRLPLKKPLHLLWMTSLAFTYQFVLLHCAAPPCLRGLRGFVLRGEKKFPLTAIFLTVGPDCFYSIAGSQQQLIRHTHSFLAFQSRGRVSKIPIKTEWIWTRVVFVRTSASIYI